MTKEKLQLINGEELEIEIYRLGFRKANQIAKDHIPIESLTFNKENNDVTINGNIDLFGLSESCLETIKGLDLDLLDGEEANRIYNKYFQKDIMAGLGQGGNPN